MRNVIVTGASRGLGLAIAIELSASGYQVIAVSRNSTDALSQASKTAPAHGGGIAFRPCDLSDPSLIGPMVRAVRADFGPIYGLINNAGLGTAGVLSTMRDQDIQRLIALNTVAPILVAKYAARSMMAQREGRIVNISSIVAATGYAGLSVYSATKSSLVGFTRSLAREVGELGITVNAIAPGFIATDMTHEMDDTQLQAVRRRSALKRMAEPQDIARTAAFLLGDGGRNITGTTITIDAGNTA